MTDRAFHLLAPVDPERLLAAVAAHFGLRVDEACLYRNAHDIAEPYDDRPAGRFWTRYEASAIRIYLDAGEPSGPIAGWFAIETQAPQDRGFADRPLARALAAALGQPILFRDPTPDARDSPYIEAAQILVEPDGRETEMWLVETGDGAGGTVTELLRRDTI